jgi:hypothetical protein
MCGQGKSKFCVKVPRRERLGAEGIEKDIVFETVEEAIISKKKHNPP